jgi:hypothetical protein
MVSSSTLSFYTSLGWTMQEYTKPSTTQIYTIFDDSTPFATFRIVPNTGLNPWGGVLFPNGQTLHPYDPPKYVDSILLSIVDIVYPSFFYTRIDTSSSFLPPPNLGTLTSLSLTSVRAQTSGVRSGMTAFPISPPTSGPTPTAPASATDSSNINDELVGGENLPEVTEKFKPSGSVIAYIIIRRKRRSRGRTPMESDDSLAKRESDKMVVGSDEPLHQSHAPHMSYHDHTQELDLL